MMNFKGLQKCSINTKISEKTSKYKKNLVSKSLGNIVPSMQMIIINRRFNYFNAKLIEKNPKQVNINILIRHIIKKIKSKME